MKSKDIKVGQKFIAAVDSKTERSLVTVTSKRRVRETRMSGKGGMPSLWYVEKTVFDVVDARGFKSTGLQARQFIRKGEEKVMFRVYAWNSSNLDSSANVWAASSTEAMAIHMKFNPTDRIDCVEELPTAADAADSAGFAAPNAISEAEFAAVLAGDMGHLAIGEGND
jgi:hypothetical protein